MKAPGVFGEHVKNTIVRHSWVAEPLYRLRERTVQRLGRWQLEHYVTGAPCKLIIAAAGRRRRGWISTDQEFLDLLREEDWQRYFEPGSVDAIVAEHVWEHLTVDEGREAAQRCYRYLRPGGCLRIAVPDGFHPNSRYIDWVGINGIGPSASDHKILYNYKLLVSILHELGFTAIPIEYYDEQRKFHNADWDDDDGYIYRSRRNYKHALTPELEFSSLIIDSIKT